MARNLPPLNALKAFEAAARHGSFTAAAAELHVTHAAISRHIRELEGWFGAKLFVRTGRGVELTETGKSYAPDVTRGFEILLAATDGVSGRRRRRRLKLAVTLDPSFAALWLVPRLGGFTAAYPDIELSLDSSSRLADFSRGEADVGVRHGRGIWTSVASELLARTNMTPVCSPLLLQRVKIHMAADLPPNLLLQEESRRYWNEWLAAAQIADRLSPEGPMLSLHLALPAAESGQGFALADEIIAGDAIVSGRLVRPFPVALRDYGYYFVRGSDRKETTAMAAFRAWLKVEMAQTLAAVKDVAFASPARHSGR